MSKTLARKTCIEPVYCQPKDLIHVFMHCETKAKVIRDQSLQKFTNKKKIMGFRQFLIEFCNTISFQSRKAKSLNEPDNV